MAHDMDRDIFILVTEHTLEGTHVYCNISYIASGYLHVPVMHIRPVLQVQRAVHAILAFDHSAQLIK